uniref:Ig-like domain-containing protein n=1 Tax=Arion vulgaris TaxID=1028688 RepID=A0A0B6Y0Q5_9EUPU
MRIMLKNHLYCICLILLTRHKATAVSSYSTSVTGDDYVFVGDDLMLTCNLTDKLLDSYTALNISFSFSEPEKPESIPRCLPQSNIHVITEQEAMLIVRNVSINNAGEYMCYAGDSYCFNKDNELLGFSDDIVIDYSPHNVTDIQCVIYNWNESMNCTWKHPVNYVDESNVNVTSGYTVSSDQPVAANKCPQNSYTGCNFNKGNFLFVEDYVIEVNVTNILRKITASVVVHINTYESVKPAPVKQLVPKLVTDMPGCFVLSWEHEKPWGKFYRIQHKIVDENIFSVLIDNFIDTTFTSCGYQPYTHHNFSVECYPTSPYSGYWSDPVYTDAWTPMTGDFL